MDSLVRLLCAVNEVRCGNPEECCDSIEQLVSQHPKADITLLPALSLCSPSCGNLFKGRRMAQQIHLALQRLMSLCKERGGYFIVGLPDDDNGNTVAAVAVLSDGKLLGMIADEGCYNGLKGEWSDKFLPFDTVFACGSLRFCVTPGDPSNLLQRAATLAHTGCDLLLAPSYSPVRVGDSQLLFDCTRIISNQYGIAVAAVNGGVGDTSSPYLYRGLASVCECGESLCLCDGDDKAFAICGDLDWDIISAKNRSKTRSPADFSLQPMEKRSILRGISTQPFVSQDEYRRGLYLDELFELQTLGLMSRLQNTGMRHAVLGVSGGLDSTLALMVAVCAFDRLSIPRSNLLCVTMPGFGTSDRTYYNALGLMELLQVDKRDIPIRGAVIQHFEDIGHDPSIRDVTYENAQARERTQILFDLANELSAVVIGTGDLSESALGWCTFGGDALAGYNVNICIPKTVVRLVVERLALQNIIEGTGEFLLDILSTPVSPELLPAGESGEIAQRTEDILGPYELHDFFLYHFVCYSFTPKKLLQYAVTAFEGRYSPLEIKTRLALFIRRFYTTQFKRSCSPDAAAITEVTLLNVDWCMPCDLNPSTLLAELDACEV